MNRKYTFCILISLMMFLFSSCGDKSNSAEDSESERTRLIAVIHKESDTTVNTISPAQAKEAEKYAEIVMAYESEWLERYTSHGLWGSPMCWFEDLDFDGRLEFIVGNALWDTFDQGSVNYDFYRFTDDDKMVRLEYEYGKTCVLAANLDSSPGLGYIGGTIVKDRKTGEYLYLYSASHLSFPANLLRKMKFGNSTYEDEIFTGYFEPEYSAEEDGIYPEYYGKNGEIISKQELISNLQTMRSEYLLCKNNVGTIPLMEYISYEPGKKYYGELASIVSGSYESLSDAEKKQALTDSYLAYYFTETDEEPYAFTDMLIHLGISYPELTAENNHMSDEGKAKAAVSYKSGGNITEWAYYDYDGNGEKEAFAVIGETNPYEEQSIYAVYFVDSAQNVTLVRDDFWGTEYSYGNSADNLIDGKRYFSVSTDNGTVHSQAYIWGVVNGKPKEFLKDEYYGYFDTSDNQIVGLLDVYLDGGGFITQEHTFAYNEAKGDLDRKITWKDAYIDYIDNYVSRDAEIREAAEFYILDIDGDAVPEIHIQSGFGASGSLMLTYDSKNGTVSDLQEGNSSGVKFVKGKNIFDYSGGHMDVYYDNVYKIENSQFVLVAEGNYGAKDNSDVQIDENGYLVYDYYWNGEKVSKNEYDAQLDKLVDLAHAKYFSEAATAYSYYEIADAIRNYS